MNIMEKNLLSNLDMLDYYGASLRAHSFLSKYIFTKKEISIPPSNDIVDAREESNKCYHDLALVCELNRKIY